MCAIVVIVQRSPARHDKMWLKPRFTVFTIRASRWKSEQSRTRMHFNFETKASRLSDKRVFLIDFLRRGCATPQKITFLAHPVGASEISTPILKCAHLPSICLVIS